MAPVTNGRHLFNEVPKGYPVPGKTTVYDASQKIDLETVPLNGGFLLKTLALSIDLFMRGKMKDALTKHYSAAYVVGEPLENSGIAVVLRTENPEISVGDHLYGLLTFENYVISNNAKAFRKIHNKEKLPWTAYLGVLGMPGKTASFAWQEYSAAQKGDIVFVTTGAGPVGSLVVQLAKLEGLKVIASAGSDDKVKFLKDLGADVAFNYKSANTREVLEKEGPINIFWDNVGGETLEIAIDTAADGARFIECGMISVYNTEPYPIKNIALIVGKQIKIFGFIWKSLAPKYEAKFYEEMPGKVARGEIKYQEDKTIGLEHVGNAILAVLTGKNTAKSVIVVAEE